MGFWGQVGLELVQGNQVEKWGMGRDGYFDGSFVVGVVGLGFGGEGLVDVAVVQ